MNLSDMIVQRVVAVNRINVAVGTYSTKNRPQCGLCYKFSGRSVYNQNGSQYLSDKNHVVFLPQGATYDFTCEEVGECVIVEFLAQNASKEIHSYAINNDAEILSMLDKIERAHTFKKPGHTAYCLSGLYKLLFYIIAQNEHPYIAKLKKTRIQPGLEYLETHYHDYDLSIQQLADISGISEVYFRKMFTEIYGMPPKKYINLIRMTKAKELLLSDEITVQQISEEVGFHDVYSFCKAFRKANDCTPTEYRKSHRDKG